MKVTFIGLGIMGSRMSQNLIRGGVELTVYNRSEEALKPFEEQNAKIASSLEEAVLNADVVITMLSNPEAVKNVMIKYGLSVMKENALWIDCSTNSPSFNKSAEKEANENKIGYLEAPVAGSKPQAEQAELVFLVGGNKGHKKKITPILSMMGSKVMDMGKVGKASAFKLVVNAMLGMSMLAFKEAFRLGEAMGLEGMVLLDTLPNLPVSAPFLKTKAEMIVSEKYEAQFPLEHLYKDLHLACMSTFEKSVSLPLVNLTKEVFAFGTEQKLGKSDMAAIFKC